MLKWQARFIGIKVILRDKLRKGVIMGRKIGIQVAAAMLAGVTLLTGCSGETNAEKMQAIARRQNEDVLVTQNVVATDEELKGIVYNHVMGNIKVDAKDLMAPTEDERTMILNRINDLHDALRGRIVDGIDDDMLNYMLLEFSKTQNCWDIATDESGNQRIEIKGIDPATRKIFVDVTYTTTNKKKLEIPKSTIIHGDPVEDNLRAMRYSEYIELMSERYSLVKSKVDVDLLEKEGYQSAAPGNTQAEEYMKSLMTFENAWGSRTAILEEQRDISLIERVRQGLREREKNVPLVVLNDSAFEKAVRKADSKVGTASATEIARDSKIKLTDLALRFARTESIGLYTYTGITKQTTFNDGATMRFSFILDFNYNLGAQTSVEFTSVYLTDYVLSPNFDFTASDVQQDAASVIKDSDNKTLTAVQREELNRITEAQASIFDIGGAREYTSKLNEMTVSDTNKGNLAVVKPYIDRCIDSYQKCIEENDYRGLYTLFGRTETVDNDLGVVINTTSRFADWDKYYTDINRYCYEKYDAYDYQIVGWQGNVVQVLVTRNKKIRGRGTQMSMPSYTEKSLMTFVIADDDIFVESEVILETRLISEPLSMIRDVTGIASKISYSTQSFTYENELAVIKALQRFSDFQLDYAANPLMDLSEANIDFGIGTSALDNIKDTMSVLSTENTNGTETKTALNATEKITWLGTWATKSNVYCRVRIREYFKLGQTKNEETGEVGPARDLDTEAYVGLVNRNGVWTIVSYERIQGALLGVTDLSDKSCLSHDYRDKESTSDFDFTYLYEQLNMSAEDIENMTGTNVTDGIGTAVDNGDAAGAGGNRPVTTTAATTPESTTAAATTENTPVNEPVEESVVETPAPSEDEAPANTDISAPAEDVNSVAEPTEDTQPAQSESELVDNQPNIPDNSVIGSEDTAAEQPGGVGGLTLD